MHSFFLLVEISLQWMYMVKGTLLLTFIKFNICLHIRDLEGLIGDFSRYAQKVISGRKGLFYDSLKMCQFWKFFPFLGSADNFLAPPPVYCSRYAFGCISISVITIIFLTKTNPISYSYIPLCKHQQSNLLLITVNSMSLFTVFDLSHNVNILNIFCFV